MRWKLISVIVLTAVMATLIVCHVHDVNGPWYWKWSWRRLPWWIYLDLPLAACPFAIAQWARDRGKLKLALTMLVAAAMTLQLATVSFQGLGIRRLPVIVANPTNTSYWTDASILYDQSDISLADVLYRYPQIVPEMHLHARYKPPGLMLYYYLWISLFGRTEASGWAGGLGVALIAALAPLVCFRLIRFFTKEDDAAFCAASFLSLTPSLILFVPQFDQIYVTTGCLLLLFWGQASRTLKVRAAIICGAVLALGLFCSYIFLVLGCFIAVDWLLLLADRGPAHFYRATKQGLIALATAASLYFILWMLCRFDPIATFWAIADIQSKDLLPLIRPFPQHIFWDLIDFGLGSGGWISYLLVIFYLLRVGRKLVDRSPEHRLVLVALIQIGTVAFAALLPGEVARLWMLLIPLLLVPVGFELARWSRKSRWIVYGCLLFMTTTICQNMSFIYMGEDIDGDRQYDSWPAPGPNARR